MSCPGFLGPAAARFVEGIMSYAQYTSHAIREAYQGYMMRSRLEVRWARWLDECLVKWAYEVCGYEQDGMRYLCDFALPLLQWWMEVKPFDPLPDEIDKARMVARHSRRPVMIVVAEPGLSFDTTIALPDGSADRTPSPWVECPECHTVSIRRDPVAEALEICGSDDRDTYAYQCGCDTYPLHYGKRLSSATVAARSMRFGGRYRGGN